MTEDEGAMPRADRRWFRALLILGASAAVVSLGLVVSAFTWLSPASGVVLEADTATLTDAPVTVTTLPPVADEADGAEGSPTTTTDTAGEIVPESATEPDTRSARIPPTGIQIESLGLEGYVRPVGLEDDGAMEVPSVTEIGWYQYGATPGTPGATVLVAHVWWGDTPGPFHELGAVEPGASIDVEIAGGDVRTYEIVERTMYDKDALPLDLWRRTGPETLVLITCGGDFDRSSRRYEQNIVVYAVPADSQEAGAA